MAKITGLGGVFYVVKDPEATRAWYRDKLGIDGAYGPQLPWSEETKPNPYSLISHFTDAQYLKPGNPHFMINLRVDDLDGFVEGLRAKDVEVLDTADEGYGKFAWVLDPDGVKIELWEQVAEELPS
ncbi:VOC family protein [Altererythrobacter arenosus]|uniref:VOC family protein n=1 Tax=Altererythrobacter arenosus TaxID=3032592 RepID=A0ABY8FNV4_9SPHN|nr:VOC family protein [Altererythrobacter sp. CAU 1644]WFL76462.1 VOC family protein [Altererythrobacter sp. CAU 1644]